LWAVGCGLWVRVVAQDGKRAGDWEETGDDRCGLGCGVVVVGLEGASEWATGEMDACHPWQQAEALATELGARGVPHVFQRVPRAAHLPSLSVATMQAVRAFMRTNMSDPAS